PHVKFILATTHPHRVPDTILSRCQRYDFARIPLARMVEYLVQATHDEGLTLSRSALEAIARNAAGGMRDALTAVDQAVAFAGPSPGDQEVLDLLGLLDHRAVLNLLGAVLDKALNRALEVLGALLGKGHDLHTLLAALLRELKDLALYHALGADSAYFQDHLPGNLEFYRQRRGTCSLDELEQLFQVFLELEAQLRSSAFAQACFEMALVKACRVQPLVGMPELLAGVRELLDGAPATPGVTSPGPGGAGSGRSRAAAVASGLPGPRERAPVGGAPLQAPVPSGVSRDDPAAEEPLAGMAYPPAGPPEAVGGEVCDPAILQPEPLFSGQAARANSVARQVSFQTPPADAGTLHDAEAIADDEADPDQPAPCDDARWLQLVQHVARSKPGLAAWLRTADVLTIAEDQVQVVRAGPTPAADELAWLQPGLQGAFCPAFRLVVIDARVKQPRAHFSL
ncbi:MAG TPA: hypothetical protein VL359_19785, partial [bacterium]|nr:hypothetical protein [bacterium]